MPLHLLGKKSWNVYNPESIARVRRDEHAAKSQDAEQERKLRDADATQRLELLRAANREVDAQSQKSREHSHSHSPETEKHHRRRQLTEHPDEGGELTEVRDRSRSPNRDSHRKRRRLAREDDTDWELRLATEDGAKATTLKNSHGHDSVQEQGMRFIDAAGMKKSLAAPWYSSADHKLTGSVEGPNTDRWGNEDPGRHQREQQRLTANDPLMAMKRGVKRLKENEKDRKDWMAQRERDLKEIEQLAREHHRKEHRRHRHHRSHRRRHKDEKHVADSTK